MRTCDHPELNGGAATANCFLLFFETATSKRTAEGLAALINDIRSERKPSNAELMRHTTPHRERDGPRS